MASVTSTLPFSAEISIVTNLGTVIVQRPTPEFLREQSERAKSIFIEAFSTTYREYHRKSGVSGDIEPWLKLRDGLTFKSWLENTYDGEYNEAQEGKLSFVYLLDSSGNLLGWLTHSQLKENGDVYLSQCCLTEKWRNQKVATTVFKEVIQNHLQNILPEGTQEVKLIARRINEVADPLYRHAGFTKDEYINPHDYGDSYNNEVYVGYRLRFSKIEKKA